MARSNDRLLGYSLGASLLINALVLMVVANGSLWKTASGSSIARVRRPLSLFIVTRPPHTIVRLKPASHPIQPSAKPTKSFVAIWRRPQIVAVQTAQPLPHASAAFGTARAAAAVSSQSTPTPPTDLQVSVGLPVTGDGDSGPPSEPGGTVVAAASAEPQDQSKAPAVNLPRLVEPPVPTGDWPTTADIGEIDGVISANLITAIIEVDKNGTVRDVRFRPATTGDPDVDDKLRELIEQMRFRPAISPSGGAVGYSLQHDFHVGN